MLQRLESSGNTEVQDMGDETTGKDTVMTMAQLREKWRYLARNLPDHWAVDANSLDSALNGALGIR